MKIEDLANRKRYELKLKIGALENELQDWCNKSEEKGHFEKHNTQIRAVSAHMAGWNTRVREKLDEYGAEVDPNVFLSKCVNAERLILSEHRIWDYFRTKLLQREDPSFRMYLAAADEFAWACYKDVQNLIYPGKARLKEPPLVFFNGGASPFSLSRDRSFQLELVPGENLAIDRQNLINRLPISVVGVPWQQISHLPEALVLGHEVGHIVEDDFQLRAGLEGLLDEALSKGNAQVRKDAWLSWLGEIFADIYGCLAGGPAFAGALIDFLAKEQMRVSGEEKTEADWGSYPTDYLRIKIVLKALETMGFENEVADYRELWKDYSSKMPPEFTEDAENIAVALLTGKHPVLGESMMSVFPFTEGLQKKAVDTADELYKIKTGKIIDIPTTNIRALFSALRKAFETTPEEYSQNSYGDVILRHINANVIKPGVRAGEIRLGEEDLKKNEEKHHQAGMKLLDEYLKVLEKG
jgi:hypothetical protein